MLAIGCALVVVVAWSMLTASSRKPPLQTARETQTAGCRQSDGKPDRQLTQPANPAASRVAPGRRSPSHHRTAWSVSRRGDEPWRCAEPSSSCSIRKMWSRDLRWLALGPADAGGEVRAQDGLDEPAHELSPDAAGPDFLKAV